MYDDSDEIDALTRIEKNYGPLTKKLDKFSVDAIDKIEKELLEILQKYKSELRINKPLPKIRMWLQDNKVNFLFFDKTSGRRIILGEWLKNGQGYYEH